MTNPLTQREIDEIYREADDEYEFAQKVEEHHGVNHKAQAEGFGANPRERYVLVYAEIEELLEQLTDMHHARYGDRISEIDWRHVAQLEAIKQSIQYTHLIAYSL